ncbi:PIN domain protein [uncultured archaeon]|nr:PIN domain protein [uncultured archaeon]
MKIYVDTNVFLDYLLERKNKQGKDLSGPAFSVFKRAVSCEFYIILSNHLLNELHRMIKEDDTRMLLNFLNKKIITVEDEHEHKGDEKHAVLAINAGADLIVTRNKNHFLNFSIKAVLPEEL